jgi:hypothetical protein
MQVWKDRWVKIFKLSCEKLQPVDLLLYSNYGTKDMSVYVIVIYFDRLCKIIKINCSQIWRLYKIVYFPQLHSLFTKLNVLADEDEISTPVLKY